MSHLCFEVALVLVAPGEDALDDLGKVWLKQLWLEGDSGNLNEAKRRFDNLAV